MESDKTSNFELESLFESNKIPHEFKRYIGESQKHSVLIQILPEIFHKLKNKLTPILGYTQLLYLKAENSNMKERLEKIEKNTEELNFLLDQLSDYFKNGSNIKFKVNLNDIIFQLGSYFAEIKKKNKIHFHIEVDEKIPDDFLIYGQIENLIINLIDNAVQAIKIRNFKTPCNTESQDKLGFIQVKTQMGIGNYKLIIKDDGIGIKQENLSKIWLPFYSEFSQKPGIGLLLCDKSVKNHGALIQVNSQEGVGTEFEIIFKTE